VLGIAVALAALVVIGGLETSEAVLTAAGIVALWVANHLPSKAFAAAVRLVVFGVWLESLRLVLDKNASFNPLAAIGFGVAYAAVMAITEAVGPRLSRTVADWPQAR
jgi:predicted small integral membrane protein